MCVGDLHFRGIKKQSQFFYLHNTKWNATICRFFFVAVSILRSICHLKNIFKKCV